MGLKWTIVVVMVLMVTLSAARRTGGFRRPGGVSGRAVAAVKKALGLRRVKGEGQGQGQRYSWDQPLSVQGKTVRARAFVPEDESVVYVSTSANLAARVLPSRNLYSFSGTPGTENETVVVTRVAKLCLKRDVTLTFDDTVQTASKFNTDGTSADLRQVSVDGTGRPMDSGAVDKLFGLHPSLRDFCRRAQLVDVELLSTNEEATKTVKTVTFDEELSIKLRMPASKKPRRFT